MHDLEPFFNWRHIYIAEEDPQSPFYGRVYNEFEFTRKVYNYFIHPQWDYFGSDTLYLKILMVDYELHYAIIELIGEWNDTIENDIDTLKNEVIKELQEQGITKFVLIAENVLNFHLGDKDYYEQWFEETIEADGWIICLNMPEQTQYDFIKGKLNRYIELSELEDWRRFKPYHVYKKFDDLITKRLV
jgi:hypothetical protein